MPLFGVPARSLAMTMADPRRNAKGEAIMRVPDRDELRDPVPGLRLEEFDRVRPIGRRLPGRVAAPRDHPTRVPPTLAALLVACGLLRHSRREVRVLLDSHGFSFTTWAFLRASGSGDLPVWSRTGYLTATTPLAGRGRVKVAPVGFQRRFDLSQDIAVL